MDVCVLSDRYPTHNARGGAAVVAARLAKAYAKRGCDVTVVTTTQGLSESTAAAQGDDGTVVRAIPVEDPGRLRSVFAVYKPQIAKEVGSIIDEVNPDVVHAHNVHEFLSYHSLRAIASRSVPTVLTFHDAMSVTYGKISAFASPDWNPAEPVPQSSYRVGLLRRAREGRRRFFPLRTPLARWFLNRYVDRAVAVSRTLRDALTVNGVDIDEVIHNGVDIDRFTGGDPQQFRERFDLGEGRILMHGGRLGRMKGSDCLARAFSRLAASYEDLRLLMTGNEDVKWLRDVAAPHGDRIVATGWLTDDEMIDAYHAATTVVSPSIYLDPFPTVNIEAMAAGTPVVASCFSGGREAVGDGEAGIVTNPLDLDRFTDDLRKLIDDPDRTAKIGERARERARSKFSIKRQTDAYLDVFNDVMER